MKFVYKSYLLLSQIYLICWLSFKYYKSYFVIILIKLTLKSLGGQFDPLPKNCIFQRGGSSTALCVCDF